MIFGHILRAASAVGPASHLSPRKERALLFQIALSNPQALMFHSHKNRAVAFVPLGCSQNAPGRDFCLLDTPAPDPKTQRG
jgi:hypothetical protein